MVDESANASHFDAREVAVPRVSRVPPIATSPISTNDMSFSYFQDEDAKDEVADETTSEEVVNDSQFQLESLQDALEELKKENDDLRTENENLRSTCNTLLHRVDELRGQNADLISQNIHKNHEIAKLKLRVGGQGKLLFKFRKGLFPHNSQRVGAKGTLLNGREVYWRKASQCAWDEDLHGPIFGHDDPGCNFVMVQRCDGSRDTDEPTLVHGVGCHVKAGTMLKFKINDEVASFGF